jgi:hypothetical protein
MNILSKKLRELEQNIVNDTPKTETLISIGDPAENQLHNRATDILADLKTEASECEAILRENPKAVIDYLQLLPRGDDAVILDRSKKLLMQRGLEVFDNTVAQYVHLNDSTCKYVFYSRLYWFLSDMNEWLFLLWRENEVMGTPGFFDLCYGEQDKLLKPIYDEWRGDWLTEKSWKRDSEEHLKISQTGPQVTAEEIAEEEKEEQRDREFDAKLLREKCPNCSEKCEWFHNQAENKK